MTAMRHRVTMGQRWQRGRGGELVEIRQVHRADRQVDVLVLTGEPTTRGPTRRSLSFSELRRQWRPVHA